MNKFVDVAVGQIWREVDDSNVIILKIDEFAIHVRNLKSGMEYRISPKVFVNRTDYTIANGIEEPVAPIEKGRKDDSTKPRWSLLPYGTIVQVLGVLEFGAKKYEVGNWKHVPDARTRYYDATMRHLEAWWLGQENDSESGLPHLAHAVCCLLFLMWFDVQVASRDAILKELKGEN